MIFLYDTISLMETLNCTIQKMYNSTINILDIFINIYTSYGAQLLDILKVYQKYWKTIFFISTAEI